jgi:hypothetical protein
MDLLPAEIVSQKDAPYQVSPGIDEALSASAALATGEPVLFVFVPFEKCYQQYCLTADVMEKTMSAQLSDSLYVVEVPVHSFYIYTIDAPPDFIVADWDLYPAAPQNEWMPEATLTEFGWGITETMMVLVDDGGQMVHDFGAHLDMEVLDTVLE